MIWNGIDVDIWGAIQTLQPRNTTFRLYAGYEELRALDPGMIEDIPLDIRYASFCGRLRRAMQ